jgi:hypothetical protein
MEEINASIDFDKRLAERGFQQSFVRACALDAAFARG